MKTLKNKEELEIFFNNYVSIISSRIRISKQANISDEEKLANCNYAKNIFVKLFNNIKDLILEDEELAKKLLSGDFATIFMKQTPMFVILDFLYCLVTNYIDLTEQEKKAYEELIDYTRNLKYEANIAQNWHINPELLPFLVNNKVISEASCVNNKVSFKKRTKYGKEVYDSYQSTISAYKIFYPNQNKNIDDYQFNYDYEKFPELTSENIWGCFGTNKFHEWGNWNLNKHNYNLILFKEQKDELISNYQKLVQYKINNDLREKNKVAIESIKPYFEDKNLQTFKVKSDLPWDDELLKIVNYYLEQIHLSYNYYLKNNGLKSFNEALEDETFVNEIISYIYSIHNLNTEIINDLSEKIVNYYAKKKDKEYQNSLLNSLKRLPISILFLYSQKITKNIFERLELNRILRQININY